MSRIEAEIIELNCINDSNTLVIGKIIFNWCNLLYMFLIGCTLTNNLYFGAIPLTTVLALFFFWNE